MELKDRALKYRAIGQFFRTSRLKAGLSQDEVAQRLCYETAQMISNWERGICLPPANKLYQLATMYKIPRREIIQIFLDETEKQLRKDLKISNRSF